MALALVVLLAVTMSGSHDAPTTPALETPPATQAAAPTIPPAQPAPVAQPAAAPMPAPVPPKPAEAAPQPDMVRVRVTVVPLTASVQFDGKTVYPPLETTVVRGTTHVIQVAASGYESEQTRLDFFRDQNVHIELQRARFAPPPRPAPAPRVADRPAPAPRVATRPAPRPAAPRPTKQRPASRPAGSGFVTDNPY